MAGTRIHDLPLALDAIEAILQHAHGRKLAVFLDYDGTLTPIVARPELAILSDAVRLTIRTLAECCVVVIISGRDRQDVERLVGLDSLIYAGSHGFDIAGPHGLQVKHEEGARFIPSIDAAEEGLHTALDSVHGVIIERKKTSVAIHYRLVADNDLTTVQNAVSTVLRDHPELRKTDGKKVYELQPGIDWNKGKAVGWILKALDFDPRGALDLATDVFPLFLGDDLTDEDAFTFLQDSGIGIVVGEGSRSTAATYRLNDPDHVNTFLLGLVKAKTA